METIFALSSGGLPCAVAVIRLSGLQCRFVIETICGSLPEPRRASLRSIHDRNGETIDRGLVLWLPGPGSFTGEDMAELQVHGSRAVVGAILRRLGAFEGLRPAEAGEFTRRAFFGGRLDLTEVEGLADLLSAETEMQRRQAVAQSSGTLRRIYDDWRERVIRIRALIEADLDFADEEDIPGSVVEIAWDEVERLIAEIGRHLDDDRRGERLRDGFQVVLLGAPNAGKSSLLNALARREAAIVTEEAGTTRDSIEVHLDIEGLPVTIVDTAGLRSGGGRIEREGMRRALQRSEAADLRLWLVAPDVVDGGPAPATEDDRPVWTVATKADMSGAKVQERTVSAEVGGEPSTVVRFSVSAETGTGLPELTAAIARLAQQRCGDGGGSGPTRERHRSAATAAKVALQRARDRSELPLEVRAEMLREAGDAIGRLTGRIGVEDLLDVVFGSFCIGK